MSRPTPSGRESATAEQTAVGVGDAIQLVSQGPAPLQEGLQQEGQEMQHMLQEAMRRQKEEMERRLEEALRLQEQRAATALRDAVAQIEVNLQEKDNTILALEQRLEGFQEGAVAAEGKAKDLEGRVQAVEASLQRAMQTFFPRVDGLLRQLEGNPSPGAASSDPPPSTSAGISCGETTTEVVAVSDGEMNQRPSASSTSSSASTCALAASAPEGGTGVTRGRVELRVAEVKERVRRTRATRCPRGEDLLKATIEGRFATVRSLLDDGADVNYVDGVGWTPLMCALVSEQRDEMVALLRDRSADVEAVDIYGESALHVAAVHDRSGRCVDAMVAAGANTDARDMEGLTPLHRAAHAANLASVRALLAAGARKDLVAWDGLHKDRTPFDLAKTQAIKDLLRF